MISLPSRTTPAVRVGGSSGRGGGDEISMASGAAAVTGVSSFVVSSVYALGGLALVRPDE